MGHVIWVGQPPQASCPHPRDATLGARRHWDFPPFGKKKKDKKSKQPTHRPPSEDPEVPHSLECSGIVQVAILRLAHGILDAL